MKITLFLSVLLIVLLSTGCGLFDETTEWRLSGTVNLTAFSTITDNVKLAAFYTDTDNSYITPEDLMISNVVNLGTETDTDTSFSLDIDASTLNPGEFDEILLCVWEDSTDNDVFDSGENDSSNLYGRTTCSVFEEGGVAYFYYMNEGWYYSGDTLVVGDINGAALQNTSHL